MIITCYRITVTIDAHFKISMIIYVDASALFLNMVSKNRIKRVCHR